MKKWIKKYEIIWVFIGCVCIAFLVVQLFGGSPQEVKERIVYKESSECYVYGYWEPRYPYLPAEGITDSVWYPVPPESCKIDTTFEIYVARRLFVSGKLVDYQVLNKFRNDFLVFTKAPKFCDEVEQVRIPVDIILKSVIEEEEWECSDSELRSKSGLTWTFHYSKTYKVYHIYRCPPCKWGWFVLENPKEMLAKRGSK